MRELAQLVGGSMAGLVMLWFVLMLCVSAAMPFIFFSVVRNISRSRRALERMADAAEYQRGGASGGNIIGLR